MFRKFCLLTTVGAALMLAPAAFAGHSYKHGHVRAHGHHHHGHAHYRAGYHYRYAPVGWHRYEARPLFWERRDCIMVGPVWYCP
jgi:hypothetical protein